MDIYATNALAVHAVWFMWDYCIGCACLCGCMWGHFTYCPCQVDAYGSTALVVCDVGMHWLLSENVLSEVTHFVLVNG